MLKGKSEKHPKQRNFSYSSNTAEPQRRQKRGKSKSITLETAVLIESFPHRPPFIYSSPTQPNKKPKFVYHPWHREEKIEIYQKQSSMRKASNTR